MDIFKGIAKMLNEKLSGTLRLHINKLQGVPKFWSQLTSISRITQPIRNFGTPFRVRFRRGSGSPLSPSSVYGDTVLGIALHGPVARFKRVCEVRAEVEVRGGGGDGRISV